ncbi:acyltransferase [Spirosoma sp. KCTC 42546]|uniref:acyltransferase family protein n=1 Tax=Spirosoma sp. KCTC 42546 TaxID=2520506 RepID=UPI00115AD3EE|nr:acyltransferase [Spirosoma sp. KCTC 42546]QDK79676.1 acyltransferase [Spirosoma sp. KCTC 42546]
MNRIKSLDGLRAISIIMVLLVHSKPTMPVALADSFLFKYLISSGLGVKIFFVISGYLITKLLIQEREKTGDINIKNFYIRRSLRIFPIFYAYIVTIVLLQHFYFSANVVNYTTVLFAALYLWNYKQIFVSSQPNEELFFGHFWTLAMEEQFYLIWPLAFKRISQRKLINVVLIIIAIMPLIRVATYFLMPNYRGQIGMMIQTSGDTILTGCLGALLEKQIITSPHFKWLKNKLFMGAIILFIFVISRILIAKFGGMYALTIGSSLSNVCVLIFVFWCIYIPTLFSDFLNNKIIIHIGVLSYSLYIWHLLFIRDINSLLINKQAETFWFNKFPQNLVFAFLAAFVSFYLIEQPINKLKAKFHKSSKKTKLSANESTV